MLVELVPWLIAMVVLVFCSAFFSASEAALFLLDMKGQRTLGGGNRAQRIAAGLLQDPDRLLTAVLFWNLVVNMAYFALASIASLRLERAGQTELAGVLALGALMTLIFFSEMLPKSLAVLQPRIVATMVGVPLAAAVRLIDPLIPILKFANVVSRRMIWPRFAAESYLEVTDLERAVELSTTDAALLQHEKTVLQNLVSLSTIRVDELMRPRGRFLSFRPPVTWADLEGQAPPSGYVLVTEAGSDEIAAAISLETIAGVRKEPFHENAEQVFYVPWCTTVGQALEQMRTRQHNVAAVVNEFGETIGILTIEDILATIFTPGASRSERLLKQSPIQAIGEGKWHVTGMTTLRRLARNFDVELPTSKSITAAGIVQEALDRVPEAGDRCQWGPFEFKVLAAPQRGQTMLELRLVDVQEDVP